MRIRDRAFLLLASAALGLLCVAAVADVVYRGSELGEVLAAIRNVFSLVAIPVIACYRPLANERLRWQQFARGSLLVAFWLLTGLVVLEAVFAGVFPEVYGLTDALARAFLESKGVLANTEAGILGLPRMRTPILNPVQGAWLLLMIWISVPERRLLRSTALLGGLALTVAKVAGLGLLVWTFVRTRSMAIRVVMALLGVVLLVAVGVAGLAESEVGGSHVASGLLHLEGLMSGIVHGLRHPLGTGFGSVGLAGAIGADVVTPGMESFVGSTVAALGWFVIAIIALSVMLFIGGDEFSRALGAVVLAGIMISDNVASLYLYAPLLLRPFAADLGGARAGK
jgi:hypothetical protein